MGGTVLKLTFKVVMIQDPTTAANQAREAAGAGGAGLKAVPKLYL